MNWSVILLKPYWLCVLAYLHGVPSTLARGQAAAAKVADAVAKAGGDQALAYQQTMNEVYEIVYDRAARYVIVHPNVCRREGAH